MSEQLSARRVPFGELEGKLVSPDEVETGLACGCACPNCGARLVAKTSPRSRRFFAHHRADNCQGGFETALHRMGKQIICEAGKVMLPAWTRTLYETVTLGEDSYDISDDVVIRGAWTSLAEIRTEVNAGKWRPDITAILPSGETVYIEIVVTHESDLEKTVDLYNLFEIYLDTLDPEVVANPELLREAVLEGVTRRWLGRSYNDNNPIIDKAQEKLRQKAQKTKERLEAKKREQQAELDQIKLENERRAGQKRKARNSFAKEINALHQHSHPNQIAKRMELLAQHPDHMNAQNWLNEKFFHTDFEPLHFVYPELNGAWIVQASPVVWQTWVLFGYLFKQNEGSIIQPGQVLNLVRNRYGILPWVETLAEQKQKATAGKNTRHERLSDRNSYLEFHELHSIVSPYRVMVLFLNYLSSQDCLVLESIMKGKEYRMKHGSIERVHGVLGHRLYNIYDNRKRIKSEQEKSFRSLRELRKKIRDL